MTTGQSARTLDFRGSDLRDHPVSGRELAKGMLLLRASNMNVMRLHLAMERRDRRLAMEALDGLVALDGELRGLIGDIPAAAGAYGEIARRTDDQRVLLASEKLIFAAGRTGPAMGPDKGESPMPDARATAPAGRSLDRPTEESMLAEPDLDWARHCAMEDAESARSPRRAALALAALLLAGVGTATAFHWADIDMPPPADAFFSRLGGR